MPPKIPSSPPTYYAALSPVRAETAPTQPATAESSGQSVESAPASASRKRKASPSPLQLQWKRREIEGSIKLTQSAEAELNLHKHAHADIQELTPAETVSVAKALEKELKEWKQASIPETPSEDDIDHHDWQNPKRTHQERWNERLDATEAALRSLKEGFNPEGIKSFAYCIGGKPVGILLLQEGSPPYISDFVTHPGSEGAGGALLEYAVQISVDRHMKGMLELKPLDSDAREAYRKLGFVKSKTKINMMTFDPNTPENKKRWIQKDGVPRLAKHADKQYVV
jgi:hypothetical protein